MTQQDIISYIDRFLEDHAGFTAPHVVDFALDVRSFITELESERTLVEAA